MNDATSQRVSLGSGSGLAPVECPGNVQPVSTRYRTIVVDPPWDQGQTGYYWGSRHHSQPGSTGPTRRSTVPYDVLTVDQICDLPVSTLAGVDAHVYLWTTQRYLRASFDILDAWGFSVSATLTWCKPPKGFMGGAWRSSTEFCHFATRGSLPHLSQAPSRWFTWSRSDHSAKPDAFLDTVEQVSPGPYLELFARRQRLGWDTWGDQALEHVNLDGQFEDTDPLQTRSGSQSA